jgi:hypothetical protein
VVAYNKFNAFVEDVAEKVHNLGADTLKIMLTNTAPVATNAVKADITELGAGGGYTAGGNAITITSSAQTSGTYKLVGNDVVFTATTGFGPFRYAVMYNSTPAAGNLIAWWDYGSAVTLLASETFTVDLDQTAGILTIA